MNRSALIGCFLLLYSVLALPAQVAPSASTDKTTSSTQPQVLDLEITPGVVSNLYLRPNIATSILMPDAVADVVLGAPSLFDAEHSENSPDLVVVKPITDQPATSNLLIATRSGRHVSLTLISQGEASLHAPVDYVVVYQNRPDFLIPSDDPADALVPGGLSESRPVSVFERVFEAQQHIASPLWETHTDPRYPARFVASVSSVTADGHDLVVGFSVLNDSSQWIELLPPQIELNNPVEKPGRKKRKKLDILADQVPITDYRYTQRKLAPGARADGTVSFERPDFKEARERLQLELATAGAVDRPVLLNLQFTAPETSTQTKEDDHVRP